MKKRQSKKGSVLVYALILLTILLISSLTIAGVAAVEKKSGFATQKSVLAFQAADSGAERVIQVIYRYDSPPIATMPLNGGTQGPGNPGGHTDLNAVAQQLTSNTTSPTCDSTLNFVSGTNDQPDPAYTFNIVFLDENGIPIGCSDPQWRDKLYRIKSTGFYRGTSRVIEIGIRPRK